MGWTCLSTNSVCGITSSSKNNLDRRDIEKKTYGKKSEMAMQENAEKSSCEFYKYPRDGVN